MAENLLKISGVTGRQKASGFLVDDQGRLQFKGEKEIDRIIGNIVEPYPEDYVGPAGVYGRKLKSITPLGFDIAGGDDYWDGELQHAGDRWIGYIQKSKKLIAVSDSGNLLWEKDLPNQLAHDGMAIVGYKYVFVLDSSEAHSNTYLLRYDYLTGELLDGEDRTLVIGENDINHNYQNHMVYAPSIDRLIVITGNSKPEAKIAFVDPENLSYEEVDIESSLDLGPSPLGRLTALKIHNDKLYVVTDGSGIFSADITDSEVDFKNSIEEIEQSKTSGKRPTNISFVGDAVIYSNWKTSIIRDYNNNVIFDPERLTNNAPKSPS